MQVGMTKDQGSYNKPSAAVNPRVQYNTIQYPREQRTNILVLLAEGHGSASRLISAIFADYVL